MKKIFLLILLLIQVISACVTYVKPAGVEPSASPLSNKPYKVLGQAETMTSNFVLFWLIDVTPRPDMNRAILEAVQMKNGDDLIDIRWWKETQYWIFGTINIIHIKGKVIQYIDSEEN